jgi:hypothetical protein
MRRLVLEGHMRFQDVLELTPWQIMVLMVEKPDLTGQLSRDTLDEVMSLVPENWEDA